MESKLARLFVAVFAAVVRKDVEVFPSLWGFKFRKVMLSPSIHTVPNKAILRSYFPPEDVIT
jgi:hypothetical protein